MNGNTKEGSRRLFHKPPVRCSWGLPHHLLVSHVSSPSWDGSGKVGYSEETELLKNRKYISYLRECVCNECTKNVQ